ncbi:hypothetical protein EVAR_28485_1 [Eumeta japonica]|uniref:Uncharacterized protein n=1 Tax=Eumeta variegata TaxID=151549 RepID=A0A4C1WQ77_EUMVA|nr:hypothetical protein EVAR_28485_1 [Eumeta japonica]
MSSVQYSNARGREKERYSKVESRREKEMISLGSRDIGQNSEQSGRRGARAGLNAVATPGVGDLVIGDSHHHYGNIARERAIATPGLHCASAESSRPESFVQEYKNCIYKGHLQRGALAEGGCGRRLDPKNICLELKYKELGRPVSCPVRDKLVSLNSTQKSAARSMTCGTRGDRLAVGDYERRNICFTRTLARPPVSHINVTDSGIWRRVRGAPAPAAQHRGAEHANGIRSPAGRCGTAVSSGEFSVVWSRPREWPYDYLKKN